MKNNYSKSFHTLSEADEFATSMIYRPDVVEVRMSKGEADQLFHVMCVVEEDDMEESDEAVFEKGKAASFIPGRPINPYTFNDRRHEIFLKGVLAK